MKYLIWKFPYLISFLDEDGRPCDPHLKEEFDGKASSEIIGVEIGENLHKAIKDITNDILIDMRDTYKRDCYTDPYRPASAVYRFTNAHFDYEIFAYADVPDQNENICILYGVQEKND